MDEILELQRKLAEVQEISNIHRISDRVVVDIVTKLLQSKNLKLFFSKDGQEYVTPDYLDIQIYEQVQSKGRLNILELPELLNIGFEKIDQRLESVCSKFQDILKINDYMVTDLYIDNVFEEINEELQQRSSLSFGEICQKYFFPKDFIEKQILQRLATQFKGAKIQGDKISTDSFLQRNKAKIRAILRACIKPVSINLLAKEHNLDITDNLASIVEELIKNDEIEGKLQSGGMYVPTKFLKNQEIIVKNFFKQNAYIEYDMLTKQLFIQKPQEYLKKLFKDNCIFLETCCFNKESLEGLKEQLNSLLNLEGYTDVSFQLPSLLSTDDIEMLIVKQMNFSNIKMDETIIFSQDFLDKCTLSFKDKIVEYIYQKPQKLVQEIPDTSKSQNQKGKKKGAKTVQSNQKSGIFSQEEVISHLMNQNLLEKGDRDELIEGKLYNFLILQIAEFYDKLKVELFENKKSASTEIIQEMIKKIETEMLSLQYCLKSILKIQENFTQIDTKFLEEETQLICELLYDNLAVFLCKKYNITLPQNFFFDNKNNQQDLVQKTRNYSLDKIFQNAGLRSNVIDHLPKEFQKLFKEMNEILGKKQIKEFTEYLLLKSEDLGVRAVMDKKQDKSFVQIQKYSIRDKIKINKDDVNISFYLYLTYVLTVDLNGIYFFSHYNVKFSKIFALIIEYCHPDENFKKTIRTILDNMINLGDMNTNENYDQMNQQIYSDVNNLLKSAKL